MEHFKSMGRLRFRLFLFVTWVYSVVGVSLGGLLNTIWHTHYFAWFPAIPIYFYLLEITMLIVLEKANRKRPDSVVTSYMITRLVKLILTIVFLWVYMVFIGDSLRSFALTVMLFYFICMFFALYMFYLYEKRRMINKYEDER
mgnify:FL=1